MTIKEEDKESIINTIKYIDTTISNLKVFRNQIMRRFGIEENEITWK